MAFASVNEAEFVTRTRTNLVAPSPSRTTSWESSWVKEVRISVIAWPSGELREESSGPPAAPFARSATVSLVLVSPSMLMELKDRSTAWVSMDWRVGGCMGASVQRMPRRVAMLG